VGSFGDRLRREREMRGVSLDDIAEATKIGTRLLRALEEEHFELLPGGIFNKGFVRAYAKYLGLNEEEAVTDYLAAAGESSPDPRVIAEQNSSRIDRGGLDAGNSRPAGFPIIPVLILLLVIAAGAGGWQIYQERQRERQAREDAARAAAANTSTPASPAPESSASTTSAAPSGQAKENAATTPAAQNAVAGEAAKAPPTPPALKSSVDLNSQAKPGESAASQAPIPGAVGTTPKATELGARSSPAAGGVATTGQPFEVEVRATDRAWVSIKSDGKYTVRGIISPPDVKVVRATDQIVFFTGNAGAVEISFNGQRVALAGGPNSEGVLVFNSHGVVIPKPGSPAPEP